MKNTSSDSNNNLAITDSDVVAEWIYFAVLANHDSDSIIQLIEITIASTFLEQPIISEAEIDEAVKMDLEMLQQSAGNENLTTHDLDREKIKQELITAGAGEQFEEGLAACEYLAALLGSPSDGFLTIIASYGEEFVHTFHQISQQYNNDRLRNLVPSALDVISKSKKDKLVKTIDLSELAKCLSPLHY